MDDNNDYLIALELQRRFDSLNNDSKDDNRGFIGDGHDHSLAIKLQNQFESELSNVERSKFNDEDTLSMSKKEMESMSLVDPRWELLDPNPDVRTLFMQFNEQYFWSKLSCVEVRWSPRMTVCAGLCVYEGRGGLCSVRLSTPLLKLRPRKDLIETLLHEMIHAYLFVTDNNKDHDGHGPEFHKHMYRLNNQTGTNISVYHNFHDEVAVYKQHWWKCDGPCRAKPPYFGYVKRCMNRAPSPRDFWWSSHQQTCGGTYTKVKEPEGYGQKKEKKSNQKAEVAAQGKKNGTDIRSMFISKDQTNGNATTASTKTSNIAGFQRDDSGAGLNITKGQKVTNSGLIDKPYEKGKGSNIAGFQRNGSGTGLNITKGQKVTNSGLIDKPYEKGNGANISGFSRKDSGTSLEVYKDSSKEKKDKNQDPVIDVFSGTGKVIGASHMNGASAGPIVRKLPGFGLITSERPQFLDNDSNSMGVNSNGTESDMDSDDPDCLIFSPKEKKSFPISKIEELPGTSQTKLNVSESPVKSRRSFNIDISDSDSEFDSFLNKLPKRKKIKKVVKPSQNSSMDKYVVKSPFGADFVSVSQNMTPTSGAKVKAKTIVQKAPLDVSEGFAVNRNKRAHHLDSDDSNEELDQLEKLTLGGVAARKRQKMNDITPERHYSSGIPHQNSPIHKTIDMNISSGSLFDNNPDVGTSSNSGRHDVNETVSNMVSCPVCQTKVEANLINQHLDSCLS